MSCSVATRSAPGPAVGGIIDISRLEIPFATRKLRQHFANRRSREIGEVPECAPAEIRLARRLDDGDTFVQASRALAVVGTASKEGTLLRAHLGGKSSEEQECQSTTAV